MNQETAKPTAAERYNAALRESQRRRKLSPGIPEPLPTTNWPDENIALLERYWVWLEEECSTRNCIEQIYVPMAGHVLGLNRKPHTQLDLDQDLEGAMDYIKAKQLSASWSNICRWALNRFRRFLRYERGLLDVSFAEVQVAVEPYHEGLPDWLVEQLTYYQHVRQVNWRPSRLPDAIRRFWGGHTRLWRWLFAQEGIRELTDIKRKHIFAYMDERLAEGYAAKSINQDLRAFHATLDFLQQRDLRVPQALLRLPVLKEPDALPRFLTDEEVSALQNEVEQQVKQAHSPAQRRNALLDRAVFYLLWHGGLRLGEVEELCLSDLNLSRQQLMVRQGKGMKDRTVYLTAAAVAALVAYLEVRGEQQTDHVFHYLHRPLSRGLIHSRIKTTGERVGIKVSPHRLRHTCATQLLNAGCPITTIKEMLGHRRLNSTMIYARVHDRTVAEDYYAAMAVIEKRLEPHFQRRPDQLTDSNGARQQDSGDSSHYLLILVDALNVEAADERQRALIAELRQGVLALAV